MMGVDGQGNVALVFNSQGMYRGYKSSDGSELVAIYK
jgi:beta-aspartyl-peptidase (threonine type)